MESVLHTPATIYSARHVPSWLLLAGASGIVNGAAFLMCQQFVTHLTGAVTRMGLEWPDAGVVLEAAIILLFFVGGAAASVLWIQARAGKGKRPRWASPLIAVAGVLIGVGIAGWAGAFGPFGGTDSEDSPPVILLSLLAFAMGLQNAAVATMTGLVVRTTHMSGPATDFGVQLGTAICESGAKRQTALRVAALRGGKIVAFMVGAYLALPLTGEIGFLALLAPAAFVLTATALSFSPNGSSADSASGEAHKQPIPANQQT